MRCGEFQTPRLFLLARDAVIHALIFLNRLSPDQKSASSLETAVYSL